MMTGARQGVYLSGGIVPRLLPFFEASDFGARLAEYGIFTDYVSSVPIWLITAQEPGLTGAGLPALSIPISSIESCKQSQKNSACKKALSLSIFQLACSPNPILLDRSLN